MRVYNSDIQLQGGRRGVFAQKNSLCFILQGQKKQIDINSSKESPLFMLHILLELNKDQKNNTGMHIESQTI
jgi:hypothetical protein